MAIAQLDKSGWHPYLDTLSKTLVGTRAEIEVNSLSLGSQIEAEWLPLLSIAYDARKDIVEMILEGGVEHRIFRPRTIYVDGDPVALASLEIIDSDDVRTIVKFRAPLMLP